jgi:hypothetical protein
MSYAPNTNRPKAPVTSASDVDDDAADYGDSGFEPASVRPASSPGTASTRETAVGQSYDEDRDWGRVGLAGLGLVLGVLVGVGVALLYAPQSGDETRAEIRRNARRLRERAGEAWDDFGDEIRYRGERGRKRLHRGVRRGAWKAEDLVDAGRHRLR